MLNIEKYLTQLDESQLFLLISKRYPDIVDLNINNSTSILDWYVPSTNTYFEAKCRKEHRLTQFIQKDKWDALKAKDNSYYINSTPKGIYMWNIQEIEEPVWLERAMRKSQQFAGQGQVVMKLVGELRIDKALQIDHLLLY